jgi:hypothetical protein
MVKVIWFQNTRLTISLHWMPRDRPVYIRACIGAAPVRLDVTLRCPGGLPYGRSEQRHGVVSKRNLRPPPPYTSH